MSTNTGNTLRKIDKLSAALSSLLTEDVTDLPAAVQLQCLQALRPAVCQMQALQVRLVGVVDANAAARTQGSASTATWLRNTLHVPKATELVRSAAALSRMPIVSAAFDAGQINDAHVGTIAKVVATMTPQALADGIEALLVSQASQLTPSKFASVAVRIRDESRSGPRRPAPQSPPRWLRTGQRTDGRLDVRAMFDRRSATVVMAALNAASASRSGGGLNQEVAHADALVQLCREALLGDRTQTEPGEVPQPTTTPHPARAYEASEPSATGGGRAHGGSSSRSNEGSEQDSSAGADSHSVDAFAPVTVDDRRTVTDDGSARGVRQASTTLERLPNVRKSNRAGRRHKRHRSSNGAR